MVIKQIIEVFDLLDSPHACGEEGFHRAVKWGKNMGMGSALGSLSRNA